MTDPSPDEQGRPQGNRRVSPPAPEIAPPQVELIAAPQQTAGRGWRPRGKWWVVGTGVLAATLLAASWFALPIREITVTGNKQLSAAHVKELAGLTPGFGWLYYGHWRARGLLENPWVGSALVTRHFPSSVTVEVTERKPVARWEQPGGKVVALSSDGDVMPGAGGLDKLPLIQGWGPERQGDALKMLGVLSGYNVQSVVYSPTGLKAKLPTGSVWTGDPESLVKYAGSISMYPNTNINIYPWGVSVQE